MKRLFWILTLLAILGGIGYFLWKWYFQKSESVTGLKLIPHDAVFIIDSDEPVQGWKTFSHSAIWQHLKGFEPLRDIGAMADEITETVEDHSLLFSVFGHRQLLISAHVTRADDYDFLYVCDMEATSKFSTVKDGIIGLLKNQGFQYSQTDNGNIQAHHFYDPTDKSTLNLAFIGNQLVCSYNAGIFRNAVELSQNEAEGPDPDFIAITDQASTAGLCRIYLNHKFVPAFLSVYLDDPDSFAGLFQSMKFSALSAEMDEDLIKFKGITSLDDTVSGYLRALMLSGNSKTAAQKVLSEKTALMISLGFSGFGKFYENLKTVMKQDEKAWKAFEKKRKTIEALLRISLEDDLLSWIDDEVTLARYQQERVIDSKIHTLAAIKAVSTEKAMNKLSKLESRLKLIGKFKSREYHGHEIHYLEIRGLFELLFGKLFSKIEKPYYTFIDGYVVFCDDIKTLLQTLDDYDSGKTLEKLDPFNSFLSGLKKENSLRVYLNMEQYFLNLKGIFNPDAYAESYKNRQFIICFQQMGFQFTSEDDVFDTRFLVQFHKPEAADMEITERIPLEQGNLEAIDSLTDADAFILNYISGSVHREQYDNGQIKILAEMNGPSLDGKYLEFYENGNPKVKGHYKAGKKTGKWYYYNEEGELDHKEKYRNGKLQSNTDSIGSINTVF